MAEKKLLCFLVMFFVFTVNAGVMEQSELGEDERKFVNDLQDKAQEITRQGMKETWQELKEMEAKRARKAADKGDLDFDNIADKEHSGMLRVFVSQSMGNELLKYYVKAARKYKAILVFNGLPGGSWRKLSEMVYEITGGDNAASAIQIDDLAFEKYGIRSVPSFILSKEQDFSAEDKAEEYDKVSGNIGIRRALQEIAEHGDLHEIAEEMLSGE